MLYITGDLRKLRDVCPKLQVLNLRNNNIDYISDSLETCTDLWKVDLSNNQVSCSRQAIELNIYMYVKREKHYDNYDFEPLSLKYTVDVRFQPHQALGTIIVDPRVKLNYLPTS